MFDDIILDLNDEFNLGENNPLMLISKSDVQHKKNNIASCVQIHSNHVKYINKAGLYQNTDGLVTHIDNNIYLVIQTADCVPIFMLDNVKGIIGLVHSGWRGTSESIILSAISIFSDYGSSQKDIKIYLGPSIKSCCYEIKNDVAKYFDQKFIIKNNQKLFLDLESKINKDLSEMGIKSSNVFISNICTYENKNFCSYRRDYNKAGRMYSIIG
jgi:YfiH family protein